MGDYFTPGWLHCCFYNLSWEALTDQTKTKNADKKLPDKVTQKQHQSPGKLIRLLITNNPHLPPCPPAWLAALRIQKIVKKRQAGLGAPPY